MRAGRRFYPMVGEELSVVGLGTWAIRDYERAQGLLVKAVVEYGINVVDTAEMYGYGASERLVGRLISEIGRDDIFVVTKLLPDRFRSRESALKAARRSLERLGIREADMILIHWPDATTPIDVQVRNLEAIAEEGLARFIGVSNFDAEELERALQAARKYHIAADQIHYSPLTRWPEKRLIPIAERNNVMIQAYRAIEQGRVVGIADKHVLKDLGLTPVQAAIVYVIRKTPVSLALVKTENEEHLIEIVEASRRALGEVDINRLEHVFKR